MKNMKKEKEKFEDEKITGKIYILEGLFEEVVEKIKAEISPQVKYHGLEHTLYVFDKIGVIGRYERVSEYELYLLQTAALFHDIGYLKSPKGENHEKIGAEMAEELLKKYKYSAEDITKIKEFILATDVKKEPKNKLEKIMRDADVYMLGDKELAERWTKRVVAEIDANIEDVLKWEIDFMKKHKFFTDYGKIFLEEGKKKNIKELERLLNQVQQKAIKV